jgi:hypothetical protein
MSEESLDKIERQIASMQPVGSPMELRGLVLSEAERELRAARWDRRMARAAGVLLVVGVGMNLAVGLRLDKTGNGPLARSQQAMTRASLVDAAVLVADATDAATARRFARQMAAMAGRTLTEDDTAAIDAAVLHSASKDTI